MGDKILCLEDMALVAASLKKEKKRIVTTNGAFDLFHRGHLDALKFAKSQGDILIVGVNSDESVRQYKSPDRPLVNEKDRAEIVAALSCVDYVVLFSETLPNVFLSKIIPDIHVKGSEYKINLPERDIVERNGGKIVFMERDSNSISTSQLIDRILRVCR